MTGIRMALDALEALGSAEAIAAYFESEGIKGYRENCAACPVAVYVARETGVPWSVSTNDVYRSRPETIELESHDIGPVTRSFITRFDDAAYPALDAQPPEPDDYDDDAD